MGFWNAFILLAVFIPLTIPLGHVRLRPDLHAPRHLGLDAGGLAHGDHLLPALGSLAYIVFGGLAPQHVSAGSMTSPRDEAMRITGRTP